MIDITFDFRSDSKGKDPDSYSPTLNAYHRFLWSKKLPNGEVMELKSKGAPFAFYWKDFCFSSDTIIIEMAHLKNKKIIDQAALRSDLTLTGVQALVLGKIKSLRGEPGVDPLPEGHSLIRELIRRLPRRKK